MIQKIRSYWLWKTGLALSYRLRRLLPFTTIVSRIFKEKSDKNLTEIDPYVTHLPFLEKIFSSRNINNVFEYGCGFGSTPFFLNNSKRLVSLEMQKKSWYEQVRDKLSTHLGEKWTILCDIGPHNTSEASKHIPLDLVFVDGHGESRPECVNNAFLLNVRYIVTHDTEYPGYGWERINMPSNYYSYEYKKQANWTKLFTTDKSFVDELNKINF